MNAPVQRRLVVLPLLWLGLTALSLLPIWHQRLLPMLDTPNHLALIRGWHDFSNPQFHIQEFYSLRIKGVPYILFYSVIWFLLFFVKIEIANKLFLSVYLILFPLSVLAMARALRRSPWLALGAFPLCFNPAWVYGYSSLLAGNCFCFFALAALIRWLEERRQLDLVWLLLFSTLTYFAHIMPWFVFGVSALAFLLVKRRETGAVVRAAAAMVPAVLFALVAVLEERYERAYVKEGTPFHFSWHSVPLLFGELPGRILGIFPGPIDMMVLGVVAATVAVLVYRRGIRSEGGHGQGGYLPILLVLMSVLYLLLPYQITGPLVFFQMAQRIPAMGAALALLLPAGPFIGRQRLLFLPVVIASCVLPLKLTQLYGDFNRRNAGFMRLVEELPYGASTLVITRGMMKSPTGDPVAEASGDPAVSGPAYWHFSSWPMVLRGGFSPYLFDQGIPIRPHKKLKSPPWYAPEKFTLRGAPEFDYYLVKDAPRSLMREPAMRMIDLDGPWTLFERLYKITEEP